jgi:hypothetical protein
LQIDWHVAAAGLLVGFTVGLTGMGGGALMTPLLVLLFRVQPLAAVSSDLVAAVVMKPVGGGVHLRRGTVNFPLVRCLMVGSVPAAFAGVLVLRQLGDGADFLIDVAATRHPQLAQPLDLVDEAAECLIGHEAAPFRYHPSILRGEHSPSYRTSPRRELSLFVCRAAE